MQKSIALVAICASIYAGQGCSTQFGTSLPNRQLTSYTPAMKTLSRVYYKSGKPYLAIQSECTNGILTIRAYDRYDAGLKILDKTQSYQPMEAMQYQEIPLDIASNYPHYGLEISLRSQTSNYTYYDLLVANAAQDGEQTIYATNTTDELIIPKYVRSSDTLRLQHSSDTVQQFYIKHFQPIATPAPPPQSNDKSNFSPLRGYDELLTVPRGKNIQFKRAGLYFVQTDSTSNKGVFITSTHDDFPKMTLLGDLIDCMRYITKNDEYEQLNNATDKKAELDRYWLKRNTDKDKARNLLRTYFKRAEEANYYFTTYKEGWKTDKGLIYMVFGTPKIVRKFSNKEIWFYNSTAYRPPVEFVFQRTGEIFTLERSDAYREVWSAEIGAWRNGKISIK